jgi:hypothetical protein
MVNWDKIFAGLGILFGVWLTSTVMGVLKLDLSEIRGLNESISWAFLIAVLGAISLILVGAFSRPSNPPSG